MEERLTSTRTDLTEVLNVNVFGVHNVTRAFLPLLRKGHLKKIGNMYDQSINRWHIIL
mgnify:CR=1 FL=1